jgi:hypothetical protein
MAIACRMAKSMTGNETSIAMVLETAATHAKGYVPRKLTGELKLVVKLQ